MESPTQGLRVVVGDVKSPKRLHSSDQTLVGRTFLEQLCINTARAGLFFALLFLIDLAMGMQGSGLRV